MHQARYHSGVEFIKKLNGWIYQAERFIVVASLLVMSAVMFLAVVHRSYADDDSALFGKIAIWFLGAERDDETWQAAQAMSDWAVPVLLAAIIYLGFRTASRRSLWPSAGDKDGKTHAQIHGQPLAHGKCLIYTLITIAAGWGLLIVLFGTGSVEQAECMELSLEGGYSFACGFFPEGLRWATSFSLILTLWVAFIGASMATYDNLHLKLEAANRALPERLRRITGLLAGILTAGFCFLLAYLAWRYVEAKYDVWVTSEGLGGLHESTPIPYYMTFTIVPAAWVLMGLRYIGLGVLALRGELDELPPELRELERQKAESEQAEAEQAGTEKAVEA
ncbi:MAG: TRAP transporter small permease [Deltaproteobacteria bacterium]|nr:TRAP transporter small permease [Deltaproteobacteria bacterium]